MAACESRVTQTQNELADYVMARYAALCAAVSRQVAAVAGRTPAGFDAERWVLEVFTRALEQLQTLTDDAAAHAEFLAYWKGSLARAARNAAIDDFHKNKKVTSRDDDTDVADALLQTNIDAEDLESEVVERVDSERRLHALRVVLQVLCARGGSERATRITPEGWATLQAYAWARSGTRSPSETGPVDDGTLHAELIRRNQRTREEWQKHRDGRRVGRTRRERDGLRTAAAESLGVSTTTVTVRLKQVSEAVRFTRYLAGVLAHRGSLRHARCIGRHLDVADAWGPAGYADERAVLLLATGYVRTTDDLGTRVDPAAMERADAQLPGLTVARLHQVETRYVNHVRATSPNCVAVCAEHTRSGAVNRATEI